jgi:thioredoxin 1
MKIKIAFVLFLILIARKTFSQDLSTVYSKDSLSIKKTRGISLAEYKKRVAITDKLVLVSFKADWCVPCKKLGPILSELAAFKKDKLVLLLVDMEASPEIAAYFEVNTLPIIMIYKKGVKVWTNIGSLDRMSIEYKVDVFEEK